MDCPGQEDSCMKKNYVITLWIVVLVLFATQGFAEYDKSNQILCFNPFHTLQRLLARPGGISKIYS